MNDTQAFIDSISSAGAGLFDSSRELIVTRAPGRLDLMGGIADYSGSLVLQWPIQDAVHVALQRQPAKTVSIVSLPDSNDGTPRLFQIDLQLLLSYDFATARASFAADRASHWAAYVAGAFVVLRHEQYCSFAEGAHFLIKSAVPEGKGVSSSAALEVAAMKAIVSAYNIDVAANELATLCQKVENLVVGAPCGIMDQMTASCGEANRLLELLCQPAELKGTLPLPAELEIWGIDSGIRHFVGGADYRTVRTAAFMGYRMIAELAQLKSQRSDDSGHVAIEDSRWNGYLANVSPEKFAAVYAQAIPERLNGQDFLDRYEGITDQVTAVDADVDYLVRAATRHPIYEHERVRTFADMLRNWSGIDDAPRLGELMYASHASYSDCGLGSDGTDAIVSLVRESSADGLYGAKITGGGSGGTVAILGRRGAGDVVQRIADKYQKQTGYQPAIISGSSAGADAFGSLKIEVARASRK